jgi:hypothetical protein
VCRGQVSWLPTLNPSRFSALLPARRAVKRRVIAIGRGRLQLRVQLRNSSQGRHRIPSQPPLWEHLRHYACIIRSRTVS